MLSQIQHRLKQETGTLYGQGKRAVALVYPSPYSVGMSSLGFQTIYRTLNNMPDTVAERVFLPDEGDISPVLLSYESQRPAGDFPVIAFSVAYEIEILGFFTCLQKMGVPYLRQDRGSKDPWIVAGGPLTFSNPAPLAPFADIIVMGEAEDLLAPMLDALFSEGLSCDDVLKALADHKGFYIPKIHGDFVPPIAKADDVELPAYSAITTADTVLSNMFLIESARGCSRGCTFCVMRRTTNGGMRLAPVEKILSAIPEHVKRVGLVGAAVSDHPKVVPIINALVERGIEVGLSSLRADRMTAEFVEALVKGGYRTLTVASDGASERLRDELQKRTREKHLLRVAELVREFKIPQLKVYMIIGLPGETDADIDELIAFTLKQKSLAGPAARLSLGVATFVAKRNTPLDRAPFIGIKESEKRIERLRRGLAGHVDVRPTSSRYAWVEYMMAQGNADTGLLAFKAWQAGGKFADWKRFLAPKEKIFSGLTSNHLENSQLA